MEYLDILGIIYEVWEDDFQARYKMKKNIRKTELSSDKEATIKSIISSLDYENCLIGSAYINNGYYIGNTIIEICQNAASYYFRHQNYFNSEAVERVIKSDVLYFFVLLRQEIELKKMLSKPTKEYDGDLMKLFKGHSDLIALLVGKADDEIANLIKKWARERDKHGCALIENPGNRLKKKFATALKKAGIIKLSIERFRAIL